MNASHHFLEKLLQPASVAVVGAGDDPLRINGRSLMFMLRHGSQPRIYPVNPKRDIVQGVNCYRSVSELPETPDVGMIIVGKKLVPDVVRGLGEKGCPFGIITSAGYAETGTEGSRDQQALIDLAASFGMRLMGPNCLGLVSLHGPVILSWCATLEREKGEFLTGDVGMISQSGALLGSIWDLALGRELGFSHLLSTGNEADLDISDYIYYFAQDDRTKVITCFIEGLRKPESFIRAVGECHQRNKPVIVYKVGRTAESAKAAQSHTGALTGSDDTFDALCRANGIIRMESLEGVLSAALALRAMPAAPGNRLGVFTCSGGAAGLISDQLLNSPLRIAEVTPSFEADMTGILGWDPPHNPADIAKGPLKSFDKISEAMQRFYREEAFDLIIVLMTMMYFQKIAPDLMIKGLPNAYDKPILACWIGDKVALEPARKMRAGGIPTFHSTESMLDAADALYRWGLFRQRIQKPVDHSVYRDSVRKDALTLLTGCGWQPNEYVSKKLLALYGVNVPEGHWMRPGDAPGQAHRIARKIGYPVVVKALSPTLAHKTESDAVLQGITNDAQLEIAVLKINQVSSRLPSEHDYQGLLIEKQCPAPIAEIIAGSVYDDMGFHKLLFGMGGIFAEILKDTSVRLAPISPPDAKEMISEIKSAPILSGARGRTRADLAALEHIMLSISAFVDDFKDKISEIDINPIFAYQTGAVAVDALIKFKERGPG